jgi:deazaflavin-dependent oxidoreductase (nitroreductase family)
MARVWTKEWWRPFINWSITRALRLGLPIANNYLLTVPGRKTGNLHTTPVTLMIRDEQRYLVAPYGIVEWVRNARASGEVMLSRGRMRETVPVTELDPVEAAPILKQYVNDVPVVRRYFDADKDASLAHFEAEAPRKAVFRLG